MVITAKATGLGWTRLEVDTSVPAAVDIKNDVTDLSFSTPRAVQDVTGLDKSAMERLLLLADFSGSMKGVFNAAVSHTVLRTISSTSVVRTVGLTVNAAILNNECLLTDYQIARGTGGDLTWTTPFSLADGTLPTWS